jgi:hypothetical protein
MRAGLAPAQQILGGASSSYRMIAKEDASDTIRIERRKRLDEKTLSFNIEHVQY